MQVSSTLEQSQSWTFFDMGTDLALLLRLHSMHCKSRDLPRPVGVADNIQPQYWKWESKSSPLFRSKDY